MFGGQSAWLGDQARLLVCGGANWTSSHGDCFSWSHRSVMEASDWSIRGMKASYWSLGEPVMMVMMVSVIRAITATAVSGNMN